MNKISQPTRAAAEMQRLRPIRIGILGGGPAGLAAALSIEAYLPDHTDVILFDRNASETDYPGVEYGIQERACRALERVGQLGAAMQRANPCTEIAFTNARLGKHFRSVRPDPHYTRSVVRQEFLADLAKLLRRTDIRRRHLVNSVVPQPDKSVIVEGSVDGTPFREHLDLLIAADGVHSVVRKSLFPTTAKIHDRGFSCIYMLVEGGPDNAPPGFLDRANSGRSELIMGRVATMTLFPLGRGKLAFGIGFDHGVRDMLWREAGLGPQTPWVDIPATTKAAIARRLTEDAGEPMLVDALKLISDWDSYKIYVWAMRDSDPLDRPYPTEGNVIVLGDAAHAIMPTIGMGASLAIEDAESLVRRLRDSGLATGGDPVRFRDGLKTSVLAPFAADRVPVWHDLVSRARRAAEGNFIDVRNKRRFAIGALVPGRFRSRIANGIELLLDRLGV